MTLGVTGHPAVTVLCSMSEGLPVGMTLVERMGGDATVARAADAFEQQESDAPTPKRTREDQPSLSEMH